MSIREIFDFYRSIGFFQDDDPDSVFERIKNGFREDWGRDPDPSNPWDDIALLNKDETRVWHGDPECDMTMGNNTYVSVLSEWSRISGGIFKPRQIKEAWAAEEGPITVSFQHETLECVLHPKYLDDYFDLDILLDINKLIANTGKQFACVSNVNWATVFLVKQDDLRRMRILRRIPFLYR